jgi:hypothetical protein
MNEGISIIVEPITQGVKGLFPRLKYPCRVVSADQIRGKSLKQIYVEKNQRIQTHG